MAHLPVLSPRRPSPAIDASRSQTLAAHLPPPHAPTLAPASPYPHPPCLAAFQPLTQFSPRRSGGDLDVCKGSRCGGADGNAQAAATEAQVGVVELDAEPVIIQMTGVEFRQRMEEEHVRYQEEANEKQVSRWRQTRSRSGFRRRWRSTAWSC